MNKTLISILVFVGLVNTGFSQQRMSIPSEKPRLIVEIIVSQMRYDYIHRYWDKFGDGGFKLLVNEGAFCKNARYNYLLTQSYPGLATISTGANPMVHGIISNKWYRISSGDAIDAVADEKVNTVGGSFFSGKFSPKNIITSTFGDELNLYDPLSKVIGISLDPGSSILTTGHNPTGAFWFDAEKGNWVSSSFFMSTLPAWADTFNTKKFANLYADREWNASKPINTYDEADTNKIKAPEVKKKLIDKLKSMWDGVILKKNPTLTYSSLLETPYGNLLAKDFAIASIVGENLGADDHTDLLAVTFSANRNISYKYGPQSIEVEDTYIKLDKELAHFLQFVSQSVGRENILVVLTSDQGIASTPAYLEKSKIPGGYFDPKKAMALLGSYLKAIYGQGSWVTAYYEKQIYLNRRLIEDSNLKLADFQQKIADFMLEFSGVSNAITGSTLQSSNFTTGIFEKFQNSYNQRRSGDVIINLEPGWVESNGGITSGNSAYSYDVHVPLIWYGWKIKRRSILSPVNMTDISPTLSTLIGITWPNGATGNPIKELIE
ncbi:MAG: alkaline phosphatase family protein [Bacteroidales bacterium]|nr:alkaline phosphatase family protein [Bacteroidales bacterium]